MTSRKKDYNQIVKATSLFGGVQVVTILIGIIRSKIVAILLGSAGVGVMNLLTVNRNLIQTITGLGLSSSAVRDISEANGSNDSRKIAFVIKAFRRWVWFTGITGTLVLLLLSSRLSVWTFGTKEYTWAFAWLSVTCLISSIAAGQSVLLQGLRKLRQMAVSSVLGSVLGLATSIPLYYYFGIRGIVPSLIITAVSALLINYYFSRQIQVDKIKQTWKETWKSGNTMVKLGFVMMLNGLMLSFVSYVVNLFISNHGGISQVGLYNSGWTVTNQYTALIFTAMGTDYFPRLAAINTDNAKLKTAVNQQAEIAILILGPMLVALIGFVPFVVYILYTKEFLPITGMIKWNMMGMLFKASSWAMAFSIIAKGDNRIFLFTETAANIIVLSLNIAGYYFFGLDGIGISFTASYIIYFLIIAVIVAKRYSLSYEAHFWKIFAVQFAAALSVFTATQFLSANYAYIFAAAVFILSAVFSLYGIKNRIELKSLIKEFRLKKK